LHNHLRTRVKHHEVEPSIIEQDPTDRFGKQAEKDGSANGEIQGTVRLHMRHDIMIQNVLPQRVFQVGNQRGTDEALDLYRDFALPPGRGGQQVLCT
jgi:hypothetical protein